LVRDAERARTELDTLSQVISANLTRTATEQHAAETAKLNELLQAGAIDQATYAHAVEDANDRALRSSQAWTDGATRFLKDYVAEGGVLALGTLASRAAPRTPALCWLIPALTIAGLALFYGDGLITPAISVLSAVEGLKTAAPALEPYVVPAAACVLLGLFLIQRRGTARVGALFGPVMLAWFVTLGLLGLAQIVQNPAVLAALDPRYALGLFEHAGWQAFLALGAIVLAVTGAEAHRGVHDRQSRGRTDGALAQSRA
jgi:K+ potassium transporter